MKPIEALVAIVLSLTPLFEARGAFLYVAGLELTGSNVNYAFVFTLIYFFSTIPSIPIVFGLRVVEEKLINRFSFIKMLYDKSLKRARGKSQKIARSRSIYIALTIFVAIPLPGTGVWTGSLVAYILGLNRFKSLISISIGNLTACLTLLFAVLLFRTLT